MDDPQVQIPITGPVDKLCFADKNPSDPGANFFLPDRVCVQYHAKDALQPHARCGANDRNRQRHALR
jgi:hypothetical protein